MLSLLLKTGSPFTLYLRARFPRAWLQGGRPEKARTEGNPKRPSKESGNYIRYTAMLKRVSFTPPAWVTGGFLY